MGGLFTVLYDIWIFCNCTISNFVYVTFHYQELHFKILSLWFYFITCTFTLSSLWLTWCRITINSLNNYKSRPKSDVHESQ